MRYLVTGGAGFIGSHFVRLILGEDGPRSVIVLDKLTYAGNMANLEEHRHDKRFRFVHGDICDQRLVDQLFEEGIDVCVNFAAETHVDRSVLDPGGFIQTDMYGVFVLLEAARTHGVEKFIQISTDEVYGQVLAGSSKETDQLLPRNPYSASKCGGDRLAFSYHETHGLPVVITRASNTYGSHQYPEKVLSLFSTNALEDKELPVYGDGKQIRDWLHVDDHCRAIRFLIDKGVNGEVYNVGGGNERTNLEITKLILDTLEKPESLIKYVKDRPGHDRRYSLDSSKLRELGFRWSIEFEQGMRETIRWYRDNRQWWEPIKSGEFKEFYLKHYVTERGMEA